MGSWNSLPWGNDQAADCLADFFEETQIAEKTRDLLLRNDVSHDEVRAVAGLIVLLGRTYMWPTSSRKEITELAIKRLKEIKGHYKQYPDYLSAIESEIEILEARIQKKPLSEKAKSWWLELSK